MEADVPTVRFHGFGSAGENGQPGEDQLDDGVGLHGKNTSFPIFSWTTLL
ncbi:hypothetical protein [Amycolatopsis sp. lyj-90]